MVVMKMPMRLPNEPRDSAVYLKGYCDAKLDYEVQHGMWVNDKGLYRCSECNELWTEWWVNVVPIERMNKMMKYCPNCGARMDEDWEEPEINPCRGCEDYDGRGGCISNGGCRRDEIFLYNRVPEIDK